MNRSAAIEADTRSAAFAAPQSRPVLALRAHEELLRQVLGRVVGVTGGSSGIGLETARRVADAGATILICGRASSGWRTSSARSAARVAG
jgi:hypothetical protein